MGFLFPKIMAVFFYLLPHFYATTLNVSGSPCSNARCSHPQPLSWKSSVCEGSTPLHLPQLPV